MRLIKARVQNYRSIIDTGEFTLEELKTILVGPNEAGKTVLLKALQQLNKPEGIQEFKPLRDYPRSKYNDVSTGEIDPKDITVVTGYFSLCDEDKNLIPEEYHGVVYKLWKNLDNAIYHRLVSAPECENYTSIKGSLNRMAAHMDKQFSSEDADEESPSTKLKELVSSLSGSEALNGTLAVNLDNWLEDYYEYVEEGNSTEENRFTNLQETINKYKKRIQTLKTLRSRVPVFILFNNYYRVNPSLHLEHLAERVEKKLLDDDSYDYGNLCLLKLLGFTAKELSDLGKPRAPGINDQESLQEYKDKLDERKYKLNAASVRLTDEICSVWLPNAKRPEADKLKISADGQYLKVVVEDDLGVEIELDQRSEGFQWLVSFFVVFFSEAKDRHKNAILLLDEPGMSLHALKQRDFRNTITRLAKNNQTLFSTHSPFLVGPDELELVRVVEMKTRKDGTKVHTTLSSEDPAGLLPLQEALGYDLAHSLFSQQRNLVLEGITDYWYLDATAQILKEGKVTELNDKIALVFANSAGKVVYYSTILHAHKLKVAALLDSDTAGDQAANQENLIHTLGHKKILRTKDFFPAVPKAEIEDLLRKTLVLIVKTEYGIDCSSKEASQANRPIIDIFSEDVPNFSKYKLSKAYVRWTRDNSSKQLNKDESARWVKLIDQINKCLK